MSEYSFDNIEQLDVNALKLGTYLWIWYADKIPPHLGISINGFYFSLKYNGKDLALDVSKTLNIIHSRKIASLFVEIKLPLSTVRVSEVFDCLDKASSHGVTCLHPIRKSLGLGECETLFELLDKLLLKELIQRVYGMYLTPDYKGIPKYGKEEIRSRLLKLEHASLAKYISSVG
jgi:hypothetical protein